MGTFVENVNSLATNLTTENITAINAVNGNITNVNTVAGLSAEIADLAARTAAIDSLYADKATLDSLFADKAKFDSLFADKVKLDSLYVDKTTLDSLYADKTALDAIYANLVEILAADDNAAIATASATLAQGYAESIVPSSFVKNVDTIADLATIDATTLGTDNVFVKDLDRGGLFVWSSTGTANGGTVFAGLTGYWIRQFSGIMENTTVYIPTDYATLQEAIDDLSRFSVMQGVTIDLMIERGHSPSSFLRIEAGDYGHFSISSEDSEVVISSVDLGQEMAPFLYVNGAVAPKLNCLIDGNGVVFQGCYYIGQSTGNISRGCGVKNVRERGLYVGTSTVSADGCNFSGAGQDGNEFGRCLWATRGATVTCEEANFTGCTGSVTSIYISRASTVHAALVNVDTINSDLAVWVHRASRFNAQNANISGNVYGHVVRSARGSTVVLNEATITVRGTGSGVRCFDVSSLHLEDVTIQVGSGTPNVAVWCSRGKISLSGTISPGFSKGIIAEDGGEVNAGGVILGAVTGANGVLVQRGGKAVLTNADLQTNASDVDVACTSGSIITLNGATTTNSASPGSPNVNDTTAGVRGGFNSFLSGGRGIIFA